VKLNAVSGDQLTLIGEKQLVLGIEGSNDKVKIQVIFQVARNAKKNILSAGKLFRAELDSRQAWILKEDPTSITEMPRSLCHSTCTATASTLGWWMCKEFPLVRGCPKP